MLDMTAIFWVLLHFPFPEIFACSSLELHHRMVEKKSQVLGTESQVENLHAVSNMTVFQQSMTDANGIYDYRFVNLFL
jgi:hypothetical protein